MRVRKQHFWMAMLGVGGTMALSGCQAVATKVTRADTLISADLFSSQPEIMSAGYGFEGIIGVNGGEAEVRAAGGAWNNPQCTTGAKPVRRVQTSSVESNQMMTLEKADAMPIVFSWPYLPSTMQTTDFRVVLNDGTQVTPDFATIQPNFEYNERQVAVLFGEFGNRIKPGEEGARYPVRVEIVADDTPLQLVGPKGLVSAVGLSKESSNPYLEGPSLVAAKLTRTSIEGEGGPELMGGPFPNDGVTLYGDRARFRLRTYTSGGFSHDGVRGLRPDEFEVSFRLHATGPDGQPVLIDKVDQPYAVKGGSIRVLGLADLGLKAGGEVAYDDCYLDDFDNYIDVMLDGDEAAMRSITHVEVPAEAPYLPFYNPGGPGREPTPGVTYTRPGPRDLQPVLIAIDDPMVVSYEK